VFPAKIALVGTSMVTVLPAPTMAFSPTTRWREWSLPSRWKPPFDEGALHTPVLLGRERTIGSCGVGPAVVDQGDTVSDEDLSSTVTPSLVKVQLEILRRFPSFTFFRISTNASIFVPSPISPP